MSYSSEAYFNDFKSDLELLGLSWNASPITDVCHLVSELELTTNISYRCKKPTIPMSTRVGARILDWVNSYPDLMFNPKANGIGVCPEAEPKFVANLDAADNECLASPLIIIDDDEPVALAKAYGEPTIYSFVTKPSIGLFEDAISINPVIDSRVRKLERHSGAYLLQLSDIREPFEPLRLSVFTVPEEYRDELEDGDDYWQGFDVPVSVPNNYLFQTCQKVIASSGNQMLRANEFNNLLPV